MNYLLRKPLYPVLFSVIFFTLIILFYPFKFNHPFELELIDNKDYASLTEFCDMDGDGNAELLQTSYNHLEDNTYPFVRLIKKSEKGEMVLEQMNLKNTKLPYRACCKAGDYDNNGLSEYYIFSIKDSTLFLEAFEYREDPTKMEFFLNREITSFHIYQDKNDVAVYAEMEMVDLNQDGYKEMVFIVNGLFTADPRGVYVYDIHNDSLWKSATGGMAMLNLNMLQFHGRTFIGATVGTPHNNKEPFPMYYDHHAYASLLDEKLDLLFEPDPGRDTYNSNVHTFPVIYQNAIHALAFFDAPPGSGHPVEIRIYNASGEVVLNESMGTEGPVIFNEVNLEEGFMIFGQLNSDQAWRCRISDKIEITPLKERPSRIYTTNNIFLKEHTGLDADVGYMAGEGAIQLLSKRHTPYYTLQIPDKSGIYHYSFGVHQGHQWILISSFYHTYYYQMIANSGYPYRWLYLAGIFLSLLAFFLFLQWAFNYQLRKQQEMKETLTMNQLALSKKQLEPHFLLNTLNNIGQMFTHSDKKEAQYYFSKYASLLRRGLMLADRVETTLEEELGFINDYLVLQKQRFGGDLDFSLEIHGDVFTGEIKIPHSLVYTFTENAIKHGLSPRQQGRKLEITISESDRKLLITIRDNGIGREKAREIKTYGTRKGTHIVDTIIEGYNKLYKRHVRYEVIDLTQEDGTPAGTEVKVWV